MILCIASVIVMVYGIVAIVITIITGSNIAYLIYAGLITLLFCAVSIFNFMKLFSYSHIFSVFDVRYPANFGRSQN